MNIDSVFGAPTVPGNAGVSCSGDLHGRDVQTSPGNHFYLATRLPTRGHLPRRRCAAMLPLFELRGQSHSAARLRGVVARRSEHAGERQNNPPNYHPRVYFGYLELELFAELSVCTQGDTGGRKLRDQAVNGYLNRGNRRSPLVSFFQTKRRRFLALRL